MSKVLVGVGCAYVRFTSRKKGLSESHLSRFRQKPGPKAGIGPVRAARARNANGPGSNGGISPGSWLEPRLKGRAPLVPVGATNRD